MCVFEDFEDAFFGGFAVVVNVEGFSHVGCCAVEDDAWRNFDAEVGDVAEFFAAVRFNPNGFREVFANLVFVNFKSGDEADVADVVAAIIHVHESWHGFVFFSILVILCSLNEGTSAVANADKSYTNFRHDTVTIQTTVLSEGLMTTYAITFFQILS